MPANRLDFSVSDTVMGYVRDYDGAGDHLALATTDGRPFRAALGPFTTAEVLRNLGEPRRDVTASVRGMLLPGRLLFVRGTFVPTRSGGFRFQAGHVLLLGDRPGEYRFESAAWWIGQLRQQADSCLRQEFGSGPPDWAGCARTRCAAVSRLVRGFASAYLLTGDERYLRAAETGTAHLHERFRAAPGPGGLTLWRGTRDGGGPLALQDQLDALAGPVQVFRATGDRRLLADVERTVAALDRVFADPVRGGWFTHAGADSLDPREPRLGPDRARKTIGSVGGHVPAYLADLAAATGDRRWARRLADVAGVLVRHFGDYENSPFLRARFAEDWTPEGPGAGPGAGERAVVGHDLRTAWSLARVAQVAGLARGPEFLEFARRAADVLPAAAADEQRGGWYDVLERTRPPNDLGFPVLAPDRKSAWSQQQAVLAFLLLAGVGGEERYRRRAREAAAFHNAWLLDHAGGGLHAQVRADGTPERPEGIDGGCGPVLEPFVPASDGFGLCFPAAVLTALLLAREPLRLWFRPVAADLPGRLLHVAPDLLPPRSARIGRVWIDDRPTDRFDATALTVAVPSDAIRPTVQVELVPGDGATGAVAFDLAAAGRALRTVPA